MMEAEADAVHIVGELDVVVLQEGPCVMIGNGASCRFYGRGHRCMRFTSAVVNVSLFRNIMELFVLFVCVPCALQTRVLYDLFCCIIGGSMMCLAYL